MVPEATASGEYGAGAGAAERTVVRGLQSRAQRVCDLRAAPIRRSHLLSHRRAQTSAALRYRHGHRRYPQNRHAADFSRPVVVLNSHTHDDHVGGNWQFNFVYGMDTDFTRANAKGSTKDAQAEVAPGEICGDLPKSFDPKTYRTKPWKISRFIQGGFKINLGGRTVEVISTPGHTPDAVSLLDRENGLLFTGDIYYPAAIWLFRPETDFAAYRKSIVQLAELAPQIKMVLGAHNIPVARARNSAAPGHRFRRRPRRQSHPEASLLGKSHLRNRRHHLPDEGPGVQTVNIRRGWTAGGTLPPVPVPARRKAASAAAKPVPNRRAGVSSVSTEWSAGITPCAPDFAPSPAQSWPSWSLAPLRFRKQQAPRARKLRTAKPSGTTTAASTWSPMAAFPAARAFASTAASPHRASSTISNASISTTRKPFFAAALKSSPSIPTKSSSSFFYDQPCPEQMEPESSRTYLTREQVSKLHLNLFWKRGVDLRPIDSVTTKYFNVQRRAPYAPVAAAEPDVPEKFEWSYVFFVPSAGVPLTDSLVLIVRTPDDRIAARVAARM